MTSYSHRGRRTHRRAANLGLVSLAIVAALFALASTATAQSNIDTQRFRWSPHALDFFQVESAKVSAGYTGGAFVGFNYASNLIEVQNSTGGTDQLLGEVATLNVMGSFAIDEWVSIGIDMPLHLHHGGDANPLNKDGEEVSGFTAGDLGFGFKAAFVRPTRDGIGVGTSFFFTLPTGGDDAYTAEESATMHAKLLVDAHMEHFRIALNVGYRARSEEVRLLNSVFGDEITASMGFGVPLLRDQLELILEPTFATQADRVFDPDSSLVELHGGIRYRNELNGLYASAGAGGGFLQAPGNADWRVFAAFGWRPAKYAVLDTDGDGILDDVDQCVTDPEDSDGFQDADGCPDLDNDGDGILDTQDACPNEPEDMDSFQDEDGCPELDNDGDGIADLEDKCPMDPEDFDGDMDEDGCPDLDSDGDGIADYKDACPQEPEDMDQFEDEDGCPDPDNDRDGIPDVKDNCPNQAEDFDGCQDQDGCPEDGRVCVTDDAIVITDKIFFATNKSKILKKSFPLLDEIASVMLNTPGLKKVEIQGHTDDRGSDRYNKRLSDKRAKSVLKHLIKLGVSRRILTAKGYGEERPIADNGTEEGRAKNRRVEFKILARDK